MFSLPIQTLLSMPAAPAVIPVVALLPVFYFVCSSCVCACPCAVVPVCYHANPVRILPALCPLSPTTRPFLCSPSFFVPVRDIRLVAVRPCPACECNDTTGALACNHLCSS